MALNLKLGEILKGLPRPARIAVAVVPALLVVALFGFFSVKPKFERIGALKQEIQKQEEQLAKSKAMAARLEELKAENEKLKRKLKELEEQLPEEGEISSLLKQVSDLSGDAGLKVLTWKPSARRNHPSQIVYEVPVAVTLRGSYHRLGKFFESLTRLDRIVNINNIALRPPNKAGAEVVLNVSFNAVTFTAVSEGAILK